MLSFLLNCKRIYNDFIKDEVTVYAAQASFFIVLSAAPFIMILLTLIQLIPAVSPEDLMHVMTQLLPSSIHPLIESVIQDIQTVSPAALLSVTSVATIWSAARGMLGIERGLNRIIGCRKRRNFSPDVHFLPGSDGVRFLPAAPAIPLLSDAGQIRFLPD